MSDPVSNTEVEDVLSSIRRLVSDDFRSVRIIAEPDPVVSEEEPKQTAESERLVLTPALRVEEVSENSFSDSGEEAQTDPAEEWTVWDDEQAAEPDDFDVDSEPEEMPVVEDTDHEGLAVATEGRLTRSQEEAAAFLKHLRNEGRADDEEEQDNEVLQDVQKGRDTEEEPEADAQEDTTLSEPMVLTDTMATDEEPASQPASEDAHGGDEAKDDGGAGVFFRRSNRDLTAKIAALEEVIARTPDQWEPDGEGVDEYSGTPVKTLKWEDHVELDGSGTPLEHDVSEVFEQAQESDEPDLEAVQVEAFDETPFEVSDEAEAVDSEEPKEISYGSDDAILDEDALRDLVSDIVRQELQGALGERITRNVRKLVRREIQRALAAQDLD